MTNITLTVQHLSVAYGRQQILRDISFSLSGGKVLGILGGSGSGKTTLLNTLACTLPDEATVSGSILWNKQELTESRRQHSRLRGKQIVMLPQLTGAALFPLHTVKEHFYTMLQPDNENSKQIIAAQAAELLTSLQFQDPERILSSYPCQLSGGMKQRICLALCLMRQPELFLADEPTSGLDVLAQEQLLLLLQLFKQRSNSAFIITSHNPGFLCQLADVIIVLQQGSIIEQAAPLQLCRYPQSSYTRQLLAAAPQIAFKETDNASASTQSK